MKLSKFEKFNKKCLENLPCAIDQVLSRNQEKRIYALGFITVDDYTGFYLSWDYNNHNIYESFEWQQSIHPDFLYSPLVEVVDDCTEIDFTSPSDEKWGFGQALLTVLSNNIRLIPDEIFYKNNYKREDILFFATMADGDYMDEMLDVSLEMFNTLETVEAYKIIQSSIT